MSQVFSGDSVNGATNVTIPASGETVVVTGNFVNPPFQNAKAIVFGSLQLNPGTSITSASLRLRRNPTAENSLVAAYSTITVASGSVAALQIQGADVIPDGRPVQYALTVIQNGASASGAAASSNISVILISG